VRIASNQITYGQKVTDLLIVVGTFHNSNQESKTQSKSKIRKEKYLHATKEIVELIEAKLNRTLKTIKLKFTQDIDSNMDLT
jgi:hypothetical protein